MVHPALQHLLTPTVRIADIATGTGVSLVDLAQHLPPTATLHGYDISDVQFPPATSFPCNVSLSVADAKQPFPSHLHETYDIVHLRLLVAAMREEDWKIITSNVLQLLKSGGAIQWTEPDFHQLAQPLRGSYDSNIVNIRNLHRRCLDFVPKHIYNKAFTTLPSVFTELGCERVLYDVVSSDRVGEWGREALTPNHIDTDTEILLNVLAKGFPGAWDEEKIARARQLAEEDMRRGYHRMDLHISRIDRYSPTQHRFIEVN